MVIECNSQCESCEKRNSCFIYYGQSLGLNEEQISIFSLKVLNNAREVQAKLQAAIFSAPDPKANRPNNETVDMAYLEKHHALPTLSKIFQTADILLQNEENFDPVGFYYQAFLAEKKIEKMEKFKLALTQRSKTAIAVKELVILRGNQMKTLLQGDYPFEKEKNCRACWLAEVCKIQAAEVG